MTKVKVLNEHEIQFPDGRVEWHSKSPVQEPPQGMIWNPALGQFIPEDTAYPFDADYAD